MSTIALVFPGQGSQRQGMAQDFCESFPVARRMFERASDALSLDVAAICHQEDARLDLTEFTQPCILTAEIAMLEALRSEFGFAPGLFGGHSLGEYTALVAAGAIPFEDAVKLVRLRGKLMQTATPLGFGGMAAIIMEGLPREEIERMAAEASVDLANDNSPTQIVASGAKEKVDALCAALAARFGETMRIVPLTVSAPFHSRHMAVIEGEFAGSLRECGNRFDTSKAASVVCNFTGAFHTGRLEDLLAALTRQISGRVRWRDNMAAIVARTQAVFEVGPGRPLAGFFKAAGASAISITDVRTAQRAFSQTRTEP
jgi:malonyl CoA-acyl carrier protein transacylase